MKEKRAKHHTHHLEQSHHHSEAEKIIREHDMAKINALLVENFVHLQKVMTDNANKLDALAIQISKLLSLFEITAKSFTEKVSSGLPEIEKDKEFLDKLNKLLDQNKTIAKGLTLMEEKIRERVYGEQERTTIPQMQQSMQPIPQFPRMQPQLSRMIPSKEYPSTEKTKEIQE